MKRAGKRSLISGILALSLVLAGTGYAYWTDTLQVSAKATTGDFGLKFVDLGLYAQYDNETLPDGWSIVDGIGDKGYVDDEFFMRGWSNYNIIAKPGSIEEYYKRAQGYNNIRFDAKLVDPKPLEKKVGPYNSANAIGSDKIEICISKMYPGYAQAFRTDIVNVGSIAAKLSDLKFKAEALNCKAMGNLEDMIGIAVYIHSETNPEAPWERDVFKLAKSLPAAASFKVGGVDFIRLSALKDADVKDALENEIILCAAKGIGQRMDLLLGVAMDPDAEGVYTTGSVEKLNPNNNDADSQDKGVRIVMDLLWDQFNVGKDAPNPNILVHQNR